MVVEQIHVHGFAILETEHQTPIAGDSDTPKPSEITLKAVQAVECETAADLFARIRDARRSGD